MSIELSIIVPVYNVEQYLEECLDSIYVVENIKKEVILVNDGSTDGSLEILKKYEEKYPNITVLIDKKNGGLSSARNIGIKVAKGEYISFIDSDDWIDSKKYEEFFKNGQKYNLDVMMSSPIIFENGKFIEKFWSSNLEKEKIYIGKYLLENSYITKSDINKVEVWDDIYRKNFLIEKNIFFREKLLHEDVLFTRMVLKKANRVMVFEKNFYYYRKRKGSITETAGFRNNLCFVFIYTKLLLEKDFRSKVFVKYNFEKYQNYTILISCIFLKEYLKLLFLPILPFQDKLWLIKVLRYIKKVKWSIKNEIK